MSAPPWIWALLGSIGLWVLLGLYTPGGLGSLAGVVVSAAFLAVVALGQTFVVATGNGAVDLSVPSIITLSAFIATQTIAGMDERLPLGLGLALGIGAGVGLVNALAVTWLGIPPIIATLAVGYILTSATLVYNRSFTTFTISPLLTFVASGRVLGVPVILVLLLILALMAAYALNRTVWGRQLLAAGQNPQAAHLAGVRLGPTLSGAYVVSGLLAALAGVLLSARVGGAFLDLGAPYLLQSVGAVVVGGTSILGGRATMLGSLLGSLFLVMAVTTMQALRLPSGLQDVVQGGLIVLVLALAVGLPHRGRGQFGS
ncbi:MAG: ABC transporter permease [Meiothermus sp.]